MKVYLADIPDDGLIVDIKEKSVGDGIPLVSPLEAHLEMRRTGVEVHVCGMVRGVIEAECSRCLKRLEKFLEIPIDVVFQPMPQVGNERHELQKDEMDLDFYEGEEIDIGDLLREQVFLHMEIKPLCDEGCRGICPRCGADLNNSECICAKGTIDPRLEALKKLLNKGKE